MIPSRVHRVRPFRVERIWGGWAVYKSIGRRERPRGVPVETFTWGGRVGASKRAYQRCAQLCKKWFQRNHITPEKLPYAHLG